MLARDHRPARSWPASSDLVDDHEPAHVHVFGDGQAKINLIGPDGAPQLVWAAGMKRSEVRRAVDIIAAKQAELLARWREIHG
jgi:Domain of unknown function (DUF4160)